MGFLMPCDVDPYVVRKLADCIELLPEYVNNPAKMPVVQEIVQKALVRVNSDREALARGFESLAQGDDRDRQLNRGKKYRLDLRDTEDYRKKAEDCRQPVTSVWLSDTDKEALKASLDDTGILELFERQAAYIAEGLREHRHPRDAERFRNDFSFVCGEALLHSQGVEVSPGVFGLDVSTWEVEFAKPLCDYLRQFADEVADDPGAYAMRFDGQHWHINYGSEKDFVNASKGQNMLLNCWNAPANTYHVKCYTIAPRVH